MQLTGVAAGVVAASTSLPASVMLVSASTSARLAQVIAPTRRCEDQASTTCANATATATVAAISTSPATTKAEKKLIIESELTSSLAKVLIIVVLPALLGE